MLFLSKFILLSEIVPKTKKTYQFRRQSRCHYLDGGCLSSPRWTSLLVAEIFYPDTFLEETKPGGRLPGPRDPVAVSPPPVHDFQNYQQYLQKRAGESEGRSSGGSSTHHCDGVDEMGCFQVIFDLIIAASI